MGMSVGGQRGGTIAAINVTPMADVMIVLLIIFMVATPIVVSEKVKLPPAANARSASDSEKPLVLELDSTGRLTLDGKDVGPFEPALSQIADATGSDPERPVRLKADRGVPYLWVSRVMAACKGAAAQGVGLATGKPEVH
jgi:biopolymer transport protein ExbD